MPTSNQLLELFNKYNLLKLDNISAAIKQIILKGIITPWFSQEIPLSTKILLFLPAISATALAVMGVMWLGALTAGVLAGTMQTAVYSLGLLFYPFLPKSITSFTEFREKISEGLSKLVVGGAIIAAITLVVGSTFGGAAPLAAAAGAVVAKIFSPLAMKVFALPLLAVTAGVASLGAGSGLERLKDFWNKTLDFSKEIAEIKQQQVNSKVESNPADLAKTGNTVDSSKDTLDNSTIDNSRDHTVDSASIDNSSSRSKIDGSSKQMPSVVSRLQKSLKKFSNKFIGFKKSRPFGAASGKQTGTATVVKQKRDPSKLKPKKMKKRH